MPPGSIIIGVDLLPIRAIRNVKTIEADITTAECRRTVSQELSGWKADVVLCDGAPNIGSEYGKDAYVQNELVLAALKTATDHLVEGGSFCTKVYRSQDYNALVWVLQQLFEDVQAMKPNSSRSQSAEIFLVCMKYTAPKFIDPKLMDPNHVFKTVDDPGLAKIDVMHKKYEQHNKRHRSGYDDNLGLLLTKSEPVSDFIRGKDPVRMLTDCNNFVFTPECSQFLEHKSTTEEIKTCLQDLRVLGRIDYKKLLKWRSNLRKEYVENRAAEAAARVENGEDEKPDRRARNALPATEEEIQEEIWAMRAKIEQEARKEKKATREKMAKDRKRQALGMTSNSFAVEDDEELFRVPAEARTSHLKGVTEVNLEDDDANEYVGGDSDEETPEGGSRMGNMIANRVKASSIILGAEENMEEQLEEDYIRYLKGGEKAKNKNAIDPTVPETASQKRRRMANTADAILKRQAAEEADIADELAGEEGIGNSVSQYAQMLAGKRGDDGSDSSSDEEDDEYFDKPSGAGAHDSDDEVDDKALDALVKRNRKNMKTGGDKHLSVKEQVPSSIKAAQWFSHPLFRETMVNGEEEEISKEQLSREDAVEKSVMDSMPKSDRQMRKDKRKREEERRTRKESRKQARLDLESGNLDGSSDRIGGKMGFEIDRSNAVKYDENDMVIDEETYQKRELLKKGLGKQLKGDGKGPQNIEIVPADEGGARVGGVDDFYDRVDTRTYDSDSEDYDNKDRAMSLALGTMMLRKSKQKAMVDASYNRYAWNDPNDLPAWFVDDEMKHNKPMLPVPAALLEQINSRYTKVGTKEIKKVAEARMRKKKRALGKLKAAKRQATALAENADLSEKQKLKAISKAMRGSNKVEKPGKMYVVTRKTSQGSVGTSTGGKVCIICCANIAIES